MIIQNHQCLRMRLDGEHTSVKTVVTSKVGGLAGFITKKDKCIGCKTVLQEQGNPSTFIGHDDSFCLFVRHCSLLVLQSKGRWSLSERSGIAARIRREIHSSLDRMPTMSRSTTGRCSLYKVSSISHRKRFCSIDLPCFSSFSLVVIARSFTCGVKFKKISVIKLVLSLASQCLLWIGENAISLCMCVR